MNKQESILEARHLTIGYSSGNERKVISENLNLYLQPGQLVCLLGPNGAGKSTLMRTLAGLHPPLSGNITIDKKPLSGYDPGSLAQRLSLVLTERIEAGNLTVTELVSLGRTPYTGWLGKLKTADQEKIDQAIDAVQITELRHKRIAYLSDGERQKVMLARALAQDTDIILLDEPTAHLDLPSRVEMMHLLHTLARTTMKAILLSTHELDLALQAADQLWLMKRNTDMVTGVPEDLVLDGSFESVFSKSGFYFDRSSGTFSLGMGKFRLMVNLNGSPDLVFWTKRALMREGIASQPDCDSHYRIIASENQNLKTWTLEHLGTISQYYTIGDLINSLTSAGLYVK